MPNGSQQAAAGGRRCRPRRLRAVALANDADELSIDTTPRPDDANSLSPVGPDDVFLINSTSGTTGLPKCVVHTQNRWHYFHQKAVANGELTADDVFLPVIPTPFGFGIWTSHTTPIHLGATAVRIERFDPVATCAAIERHRATVLCCVSTQLAMILADPASRDYDLTSLRVVFTGGEPLPYTQAAQFEELTGVTILQFYGSNETGHVQCDHRRGPAAPPAPHRRAGSCRRCRCGSSTAIATSPNRVAANPRAADRRSASGTSAAPTTTSCSRRTAGCGWATSANSTPTAISP